MECGGGLDFKLRNHNKEYSIYLNVRQGLFLKFGAPICEATLNLYMKHRTGLCHTGSF